MTDIKTYQVSKSKLLDVVIPEDTRTYKAVSHGQLIDFTLEAIHKSGFEVGHEHYSMAKEGRVANGRYTITSVQDNEMQIQIGWQNSYDKSITLKWAMGLYIFICSNGAISGDMGTFKKKHQGQVQEFTPQAISDYIKTAGDVFVNMQKQRDQLKQVEVSKRITAELLGRMVVENEFITTTQLNIIKRELHKPTHDYGAKNSMWELYQFVTYSMKDIHPSLWMDSHIDAHNFFTTEAGILVEKQSLITGTSGDHDPRQLGLFDTLFTDPEAFNYEDNLEVVYNSEEESDE